MAIDPRLLSRVYGRHPARVLPFDERYDGVILHPAERRVVATPFPKFSTTARW